MIHILALKSSTFFRERDNFTEIFDAAGQFGIVGVRMGMFEAIGVARNLVRGCAASTQMIELAPQRHTVFISFLPIVAGFFVETIRQTSEFPLRSSFSDHSSTAFLLSKYRQTL